MIPKRFLIDFIKAHDLMVLNGIDDITLCVHRRVNYKYFTYEILDNFMKCEHKEWRYSLNKIYNLKL